MKKAIYILLTLMVITGLYIYNYHPFYINGVSVKYEDQSCRGDLKMPCVTPHDSIVANVIIESKNKSENNNVMVNAEVSKLISYTRSKQAEYNFIRKGDRILLATNQIEFENTQPMQQGSSSRPISDYNQENMNSFIDTVVGKEVTVRMECRKEGCVGSLIKAVN